MWVGLGASTELKSLRKGEMTLSSVFELGHWSSPAFWLGLKLTPSVLLVLRPLDGDQNSTTGSPACWLQILWFLSLHNCVSQFLMVSTYYLSVSVPRLPLLLLPFPWRAQTTQASSKSKCKRLNFHSKTVVILKSKKDNATKSLNFSDFM